MTTHNTNTNISASASASATIGSGIGNKPTMHPDTFNYLKPTDTQMNDMRDARDAAAHYANALERLVPDGPDKTYLLRKLREVAMWVNVSITRLPDGTPRK